MNQVKKLIVVVNINVVVDNIKSIFGLELIPYVDKKK